MRHGVGLTEDFLSTAEVRGASKSLPTALIEEDKPIFANLEATAQYKWPSLFLLSARVEIAGMAALRVTVNKQRRYTDRWLS